MRRRVMQLCVWLAAAGVLGMPARANAEVFVNPWAGVHFGNDEAQSGLRSFGAAIGNAGGALWGIETNLGYTPGFFDGGDNYELDFMVGFSVGPTLNVQAKRTRPYGIVNFGMIRTHIGSPVAGGEFARSDLGMAIGGGVTHELTDHMAIRADLRYLRSFNSESAANNLNVDVGNLHFWRAAFGVVLH